MTDRYNQIDGSVLTWLNAEFGDLSNDVKGRLVELFKDVREVGKLGKHDVHRPPPLPKISNYVETFPSAPPNYIYFEQFPGPWGVLDNDKLGDCTWAGAVHLEMYNAWLSQVSYGYPDDNQVGEAYLAYNNGADSGCSEFPLLQYWVSNGILGEKIVAFAPVNYSDQTEVNASMAAFGGLYIGVQFPAVAMDQFRNNQIWNLTNTPSDDQIEGGHCVILVGYDSNFLYCVTWGKVQPLTWAWLQRYCEEAYVVLTKELDTNKVGVDVATLLTDIAQLEQQNPNPQG